MLLAINCDGRIMGFNSSDLTFDKRERERAKHMIYSIIYCFPAHANLFIHRHMFLLAFEHYGYILRYCYLTVVVTWLRDYMKRRGNKES